MPLPECSMHHLDLKLYHIWYLGLLLYKVLADNNQIAPVSDAADRRFTGLYVDDGGFHVFQVNFLGETTVTPPDLKALDLFLAEDLHLLQVRIDFADRLLDSVLGLLQLV